MSEDFESRYKSVESETIADRVPALVEALKDCRDSEILDRLGRAEAQLLLTLPLSKKGKPLGANTLKQKKLKPYYAAFREIHNEIPATATAGRDGKPAPHFCRALSDELWSVHTAEKAATEAKQPAEPKPKKETPVVTPRAVLQLGSHLLKSSEWERLAIGLAIATGRRTTEIFYRGEIAPASRSGFIKFRGVLKLKRERWERERHDWREIPSLLPAADVLAAWERFRAMPEVVAYHGQIAASAEGIADEYDRELAENDKAQSIANRACNDALQDIPAIALTIPLRRTKQQPTMHDLRAVYGAISVEREAAKTSSLNDCRDLYHQYLSESDANYGDYGIDGAVPKPAEANRNTASLKCTTLATLRLKALQERFETANYHETLDRLLDIAEASLVETPAEERPAPVAEENTTEADTMPQANEAEARIAQIEADNAEIKAMLQQLLTAREQPAEVAPHIEPIATETPAKVEPEQSYMDKQAEAARQWSDTPNAELFGWNTSGRAMRHAGAAYERAARVLASVEKYNELAESPAARIAINGALIRGVTNAASKFVAQWLEYHAPMLDGLHSQWGIENPEYHNRDAFNGAPVEIVLADLKAA